MKSKNRSVFKALVVLISVIAMLCGCAKTDLSSGTSTKLYKDAKFDGEEFSDGIIYENARFALFWNTSFKQVIIKDKQSSADYSTMPIDAMEIRYDEDGFEIMNSPQIESPIYVSYYNPESLLEKNLLGSNDAIYDGEIYTEKTKNGISVTYVFSSTEISVTVDYSLYDDRFEISVDPTKITDNGDYIVTGVSLAPFLCSLENNSDDSYFFLPDGSGTLIEPKPVDLVGKQGSIHVYGEDLAVSQYDIETYTKQCNLPVFGVKNHEKGLFGIITSGAEHAELSWDIGSINKKYSSVYPFFRIRGYDLIKRPDNFWNSGSHIQIFDKYIRTEKLSVSYYPLAGDKANYSGMVEIYRDYLLKNNALKKSDNQESVTTIKILGGAEQKAFTFGVPHTVCKSITTVNQARDMTKYFNENIDGNFLVNLVGFGQSGLDVGKVGGGFKINSSFGSKKHIKNLVEYCKRNDIEIFMDFDLINFNKSGSSFSKSTDSVKLLDGQTLYLYGFDNVTRNRTSEHYMLLSRNKLSSALQKAVYASEKFGLSGVSVSTLSKSIYSDYNINDIDAFANMSEQITKLFSDTRKDTKLLSSCANVYAAIVSDYITDTPLSSSHYDVSTTDIPFYQMVFRGFVPMSGESVNLTEDSSTTFLKCVESGISPTYTLSFNGSENDTTTEFSAMNSSAYMGYREQVVENVNKISKLLSSIKGCTIAKHEITNDGLRVTTFENGVKTVVNYGDTSVSYNGIIVESGNYAVLEE